jgi:hypothetical protein
MKISAILLAGAFVLVAAVPAFAQPCNGPQCGGQPPHQDNDCGQYCWMEYITPINANVNVAFVDSNVKSSVSTGDNYVKVEGEIEDLHSSRANLYNGVAGVTSGNATVYTASSIMANMIEPMGCTECTPKDGIYLNANVAFIDSNVSSRVNTGDNMAKLSSEIEDLCHSKANLYGGAATVVSGDAWSETGSMVQVNMIGDWTK